MVGIDTPEIRQALQPDFSEKQSEKLIYVFTAFQNDIFGRQLATKVEFKELRAIVTDLARAQQRTETRVEELAQIQQRTEEKVELLAEAQQRTEERVELLAEAQRKTEEKIELLVEAQRRTEGSVEKLAQAQTRTEEEIRNLSEGLDQMRKQVGALSEQLGLGLEDIGTAVLPSYFEKVYGISDVEFRREFVTVSDGLLEVNLYSGGIRDGKYIIIAGEAKNRIKSSEVRKFAKDLAKLVDAVDEPVFPFMFGFWIHPSAEEIAAENGIELIVTYKLTR